MSMSQLANTAVTELTIATFIQLAIECNPHNTELPTILTLDYILGLLKEDSIHVVYPHWIELSQPEVLRLISRLPANVIVPTTIGTLCAFNGVTDTYQEIVLHV